MPNIERVIRHAMEKIDTSRGDLREQVYRAVWENHEKSIVADALLSDEDRSALRERLIGLIKSIEADYPVTEENDSVEEMSEVNHFEQNDLDDAQPTSLSSQQDEQLDEALSARVFHHDFTRKERLKEASENINHSSNPQGVAPPSTSMQETQIHAMGPEELGVAATEGQPSHAQKPRIWWRSNLILMVLLVLLVLVAFAFYNSLTSINRPAGTERGASTPPATVNGQGQVAEKDGWITVFDPTRVSDFSLQGGAEAQIKGEGNNRALRFSAKNPDDKVVIDVGSGIIEQLRGKTVTFNLIARSANDAAAQIAITCDFGVNNSCGKRNFDLHQTREDLLFSVDIPQNIHQNGQLFLQSALLGPDYQIDVFAVRVRVEN